MTKAPEPEISRNFHIRLSKEVAEMLRDYANSFHFRPSFSQLFEDAFVRYFKREEEQKISIPVHIWEWADAAAKRSDSTPELFLIGMLEMVMRKASQNPS